MKRFSDFADKTALEGDKVRIDEVLNLPIVITNARITTSKYKKNTTGRCLTIQFRECNSDQLKVLFTGSEVLISQVEQYENEIPFETKIVKIDRYFSFS